MIKATKKSGWRAGLRIAAVTFMAMTTFPAVSETISPEEQLRNRIISLEYVTDRHDLQPLKTPLHRFVQRLLGMPEFMEFSTYPEIPVEHLLRASYAHGAAKLPLHRVEKMIQVHLAILESARTPAECVAANRLDHIVMLRMLAAQPKADIDDWYELMWESVQLALRRQDYPPRSLQTKEIAAALNGIFIGMPEEKKWWYLRILAGRQRPSTDAEACEVAKLWHSKTLQATPYFKALGLRIMVMKDPFELIDIPAAK